MKKFFVIIIVSIMLFSLANFAFAQGRELEIKYPEIEGERPEEITTPVPEYVKYIYNFLIWISGFIALGVLIYAGFQYFTSAGSPEKINEAKDRIKAALLGLLILFGSYLILITINPELVVFHLPRLRPIISELPAGVLVCREEAEVGRAWQLTNNFKQTEDYGEQKIIAKELEQILGDISEKCATVLGKGDIVGTVRFVYFIPGEQKEERYIALYGAIFYEGKNFEGKSQLMYEHLEKGLMMYYPVKYGPDEPVRKITISQISSIKPFILIPNHDGGYEGDDGIKRQVFLFQEYNKNLGTDLEDKGVAYGLLPENWWYEYEDITKDDPFKSFCSFPGARCTKYPKSPEKDFCSPRSIQVIGDYIAILVTPDGRSDTFYNRTDSNLDDNLNIVNWVDCKDYKSTKTGNPKYKGSSFGGGYIDQCAQPAVKKLIIISARIY